VVHPYPDLISQLYVELVAFNCRVVAMQ